METANIFIKMMEKFCKDPVVVQDKKKQRRKAAKSSGKKSGSKQKEKSVMSEVRRKFHYHQKSRP